MVGRSEEEGAETSRIKVPPTRHLSLIVWAKALERQRTTVSIGYKDSAGKSKRFHSFTVTSCQSIRGVPV